MTNVPHACWVSIIGWVHLFQKMTWAYEKDASQELCMWIMSIIISIMWIMEGWWLLSHDAHGFFQPALHQVSPRGLPNEWQNEDAIHGRGNRTRDVQISPIAGKVGQSRQHCYAERKEVESRHANRCSLGRSDGFRRQDERRQPQATIANSRQ